MLKNRDQWRTLSPTSLPQKSRKTRSFEAFSIFRLHVASFINPCFLSLTLVKESRKESQIAQMRLHSSDQSSR